MALPNKLDKSLSHMFWFSLNSWKFEIRLLSYVPWKFKNQNIQIHFIFVSFDILQVKSVIPFSEPFTVDPENPPPERDYDVYFKTLKDGITGKEVLEQSPVDV